MSEKILSGGVVISFSLAILCFLILTIITVAYGDPKAITTDPADPILDEEYGRYMEKDKYEVYRLIYENVHFTGVLFILITFVLYGLRWFIMKGNK